MRKLNRAISVAASDRVVRVLMVASNAGFGAMLGPVVASTILWAQIHAIRWVNSGHFGE